MMLTVSSLLFCQDIKRFYMSMTKLIINGLGCFFFPAVLCKLCIIYENTGGLEK